MEKKASRGMSDLSRPDPHFYASDSLKGATGQSFVAIPIGDGSDVISVLSMLSTVKGFFRPKDTGCIQLLGALIAFIHAQGRNSIATIKAANGLGSLRRRSGGSRTHARRTRISTRIQPHCAVSMGTRPVAPSMGPIYQWCAALGLVVEDDEPQVSFLDLV